MSASFVCVLFTVTTARKRVLRSIGRDLLHHAPQLVAVLACSNCDLAYTCIVVQSVSESFTKIFKSPSKEDLRSTEEVWVCDITLLEFVSVRILQRS